MAYAGQTNGYCLSQLEAPPTTSPTTSDFTVNFWYPGKRHCRRLWHYCWLYQSQNLSYWPFAITTIIIDYDTEWTSAGCLNTLPLPYNNINDRPNYSTQVRSELA